MLCLVERAKRARSLASPFFMVKSFQKYVEIELKLCRHQPPSERASKAARRKRAVEPGAKETKDYFMGGSLPVPAMPPKARHRKASATARKPSHHQNHSREMASLTPVFSRFRPPRHHPTTLRHATPHAASWYLENVCLIFLIQFHIRQFLAFLSLFSKPDPSVFRLYLSQTQPGTHLTAP